jgi:uncharacterized membrane protein
MKPFFKSKKWWTAVIAALIPIANNVLGWELDPIELMAVVIPLIGYIMGEAWTDATN